MAIQVRLMHQKIRCDYEFWNTFEPDASVAPGDVYVICHPSANDLIQAECDERHQYLSNGDDGYCLVEGTESLSILLIVLVIGKLTQAQDGMWQEFSLQL